MTERQGIFTISLDFELMWGVRDHRTVSSYGENILKVHEIVPELLRLFSKYGVHCTWSTVGLLFASSSHDARQFIPGKLPSYANRHLDPYPVLLDECVDGPHWYAPDLIEAIAAVPGQEIGTHTFSHFYTLEEGADTVAFEADITAAQAIAARNGHELSTIVFPRNQYDTRYLEVCRSRKILAFRGTEDHWIYATRSRADEKPARRLIRLADSYLNISGHHTPARLFSENGLLNVPASRFLRPYDPKLRMFEGMRLRRITSSLSHAAKTGGLFHLWWHPHNFGAHTAENLAFLERILQAYESLNASGKMQSLNMLEITKSNLENG